MLQHSTVQILRENKSNFPAHIPLILVFYYLFHCITVMKDLLVLEQQQHESQRKLQHAQETKLRRLEYHAALETSLEQLKYQNGQNRAELSHMHNLLSKGQRLLGTVRLGAGRAGDDLRDFDRKLKLALASKRMSVGYQHKQKRLSAEIRNKVAVVWRLKDEFEEHIAKSEMESAKIWEREEGLRQDLRADVEKQQVVEHKTAETRQGTRNFEEGNKKEQEYELLTRARIENINKDSVSDRRHADTMASLYAKFDSYDITSKETQAKIAIMREEIAKKKESRDKAWHHTIRIQQAEGHPPSLPPTESNTPPVFNIVRLQEAVDTATKAAADEVIAKAELGVTVNALEVDEAKAEKEAQAKLQKALDLERSNEEAKRIESDRREHATKFLGDLDNLEKETKELETTLAALRAHRAEEIDRVNAESWQLEKQIHVLQTSLANTKEKLGSIDSSIETTKNEYEKTKETDDAKLHAVQAQVAIAKETCQEAKAFATRIIEESFGEDCDGIENACKILNEDLVAENARILESKCPYNHYERTHHSRSQLTHLLLPLDNLEYPILESVVITYDPTLSAKDQGDKDLQGLARNLSKKLESAKKMHADFEMARQLEQEERANLELAAADEAKRKQEARERRKMRLQDNLPTQTKKRSEAEEVPEGNREHHKKTRHADKSKRHADRKKSKPVEIESAAKPRELLPAFTQADIPPFEGISATQEKKVHWNDNGKRVSNGLTTDVYVDETGSSPKKPRRQTFGGASTRLSTKSEKDGKPKRRSKSSGDGRRKTDEGSSRGHNASKMPTESIQDNDMDVVEKDPKVKDSSKERTTRKHPSHSATDLVATSKNGRSTETRESTTFPNLSSNELNHNDNLKERKSSKHHSRSTSDLVATSVSGRSSKQRESTTSTDPSNERKSSKHRSRSTSDLVATSVRGRSSKPHESATSTDPSKERKSSKDRSRSTSDLVAKSVRGRSSEPRESSTSTDPLKERKLSKDRSHSTSDLKAPTASGRSSNQRESSPSMDPSKEQMTAKHRSHSTSDLVIESTSGRTSKQSESTNPMDPPKERKTKKQRSRSSTDLAGTFKDPSDAPKTSKRRSHSPTDLPESSTSGRSSKPLKSSLATKSRSSKVKKADYIDILNAKPKSSKDASRPLDSDSAFENKSSHSTKARSSTDKAKNISSSLPSKRHRSDEMTVQSTGIPSTERAPKGRRRKKTQTTGVTKPKVQSFGEDCSFDFHKLQV